MWGIILQQVWSSVHCSYLSINVLSSFKFTYSTFFWEVRFPDIIYESKAIGFLLLFWLLFAHFILPWSSSSFLLEIHWEHFVPLSYPTGAAADCRVKAASSQFFILFETVDNSCIFPQSILILLVADLQK